ncbi:MAG: hypothetical protein KF900_06430 [Bacteroidetes bacterium]|nr:hypothetical protein [Bacteroidota bacterium]
MFVFFSPEMQAQCAMCKAAAESDMQNNPNSIVQNLNKGILFLMAIPYIIVGIIFRKDIVQFFKSFGNKDKTLLNKKRLSNLTFLLTFITCATILFVVFMSAYKVK